LIDPTKEFRNYGNEDGKGDLMEHYQKISVHNLNNMSTCLQGKRASGYSFKNRSFFETNPRKEYEKYYAKMQRRLKLKQNVIDHCLDKIDQMLHYKAKDPKSLAGLKSAYGAVILKVVLQDLMIKPEWERILKYSDYPNAIKVEQA